MGIALISTSKGIKTDKEARQEGLGGEVAGVIQAVALLAKGREAREEDQRRGMEQEDRLIGIGGPGQPHGGGPGDAAIARPAGHAAP